MTKKNPNWFVGKKAPCQRCEETIELKIPSQKYCCLCNGVVTKERLREKRKRAREGLAH